MVWWWSRLCRLRVDCYIEMCSLPAHFKDQPLTEIIEIGIHIAYQQEYIISLQLSRKHIYPPVKSTTTTTITQTYMGI